MRLRSLYAAHGRAILARCRSVLRDPQAAEDAAQETFIRVLHHLDEAPSEQEMARWLHRIATNICLNELRKHRTKARLSQQLSHVQGTAHERVDDALARRQLVDKVLQGMSETARAVSVLRHVDGLYDREVAEELGISRRTVSSRLSEFRAGGLRVLRDHDACSEPRPHDAANARPVSLGAP